MSEETILQGAEPFFFKGNHIGVLVCHGFTGTTQSMRYLGEQLHAVLGLDEALVELRKSCTHIFITGLSMGGTLTLYMAAKHADVIKGAVPINGVVHMNNPDMAGAAFDRAMPTTLPGIGSDVKAPNVKELAYTEVPVSAFQQVYALAAVTRDLLGKIQCQVLVMAAGPEATARRCTSHQASAMARENRFIPDHRSWTRAVRPRRAYC